jgi:hypothetical protein
MSLPPGDAALLPVGRQQPGAVAGDSHPGPGQQLLQHPRRLEGPGHRLQRRTQGVGQVPLPPRGLHRDLHLGRPRGLHRGRDVGGERGQDADVASGEDALGDLAVQVDHADQPAVQADRGDQDGAQVRWRLHRMHPQQLTDILGGERQRTGKALEQHDTERVQVGPVVHRTFEHAGLLRGGVGQRADHGAGAGPGLLPRRQPEVDHPGGAAASKLTPIRSAGGTGSFADPAANPTW